MLPASFVCIMRCPASYCLAREREIGPIDLLLYCCEQLLLARSVLHSSSNLIVNLCAQDVLETLHQRSHTPRYFGP